MENKNAFKQIIKYLAKRNYSETELKNKLKFEFTNEEIDLAIQKANDKKLISDPKELSQRISEILHNKNKGYLYINNYLLKKGLPTISKNIELELKKAETILSKYNLDLKNQKNKLQQKQKIINLLKNRGFDNNTINAYCSYFGT